MCYCQADRMVQKQAELITKLNKVVRDLKAQVEDEVPLYIEYGHAGVYWLAIQHEIEANPILQSEWDRFCSFLKLTSSEEEINKKIKARQDARPRR